MFRIVSISLFRGLSSSKLCKKVLKRLRNGSGFAVLSGELRGSDLEVQRPRQAEFIG